MGIDGLCWVISLMLLGEVALKIGGWDGGLTDLTQRSWGCRSSSKQSKPPQSQVFNGGAKAGEAIKATFIFIL